MSIAELLKLVDDNLRYGAKKYPDHAAISLASEQLHDAVVLLEKGYPLTALVDQLKDKYGVLEQVPELKRNET